MAPSRTKKKLRIGFIGCGGIAGPHLDALKTMDDVQIVALADIDPQAMVDRARQYNIPEDCLFDDYRKMLARVKPDAVNICTPNALHGPVSIAASRAGAHVFVEKPMAMNIRESKAMIAAARKAKRKLVVGFQYRFDARTKLLKNVADDGTLGKILFGRVQALRRRGIPNWGVFGQKELQGGGPMIDIGVHALEMCHFVMGSPRPVAAVGMTNTYLGNQRSDQVESVWKGWNYKTHTVEDLAVGHIRFDNGAVIHIESMFAGHIEKDVMDFQLCGTRGGCSWDSSQIFTDRYGHMMDMTPAYLPDTSFGAVFLAKNRNFVDHVLHNKPSLAPAEDGLMIQQMLDAIYASASKGGKEVLIS